LTVKLFAYIMRSAPLIALRHRPPLHAKWF